MRTYSDEQLITAYLDGNEEAIALVIHRHLRPLYRFVYGYLKNSDDAEDITQEACVRMWKNIKKFDAQKSFKAWLFAIAKNAALDFLKKKKTIPFSKYEAADGYQPLLNGANFAEPSPDEFYTRAYTDVYLLTSLQKLSRKARRLLFLRYNKGYKFRDIATLLGQPIHTVKSRHRRTIIALKKMLSTNP